jgi:hypothetical protein
LLVNQDDVTGEAKIISFGDDFVNIILTAADWVAPIQKSIADIVHIASGGGSEHAPRKWNSGKL